MHANIYLICVSIDGCRYVWHTMLTVSMESIDSIFMLTFTSTGAPGKNRIYQNEVFIIILSYMLLYSGRKITYLKVDLHAGFGHSLCLIKESVGVNWFYDFVSAQNILAISLHSQLFHSRRTFGPSIKMFFSVALYL